MCIPLGAGLLAMAYNSAKVKAEDAPKSWQDLTDPKWKKRLALGHPAFSGFDAAWAVVLMKRVGWKYRSHQECCVTPVFMRLAVGDCRPWPVPP